MTVDNDNKESNELPEGVKVEVLVGDEIPDGFEVDELGSDLMRYMVMNDEQWAKRQEARRRNGNSG